MLAPPEAVVVATVRLISPYVEYTEHSTVATVAKNGVLLPTRDSYERDSLRSTYVRWFLMCFVFKRKIVEISIVLFMMGV